MDNSTSNDKRYCSGERDIRFEVGMQVSRRQKNESIVMEMMNNNPRSGELLSLKIPIFNLEEQGRPHE